MNTETPSFPFTLRKAQREDTPLIYWFISELAAYENLSDAVQTSPEQLEKTLFDTVYAEVLICECSNADTLLDTPLASKDARPYPTVSSAMGEPIGFALFFCNYSTFLGKPGLYLEDLYVRPKFRGKGFGKAIFSQLAQTTLEHNFGRMEWSCLDWNTSAIEFYASMGAVSMTDWKVHRLTEDKLKGL